MPVIDVDPLSFASNFVCFPFFKRIPFFLHWIPEKFEIRICSRWWMRFCALSFCRARHFSWLITYCTVHSAHTISTSHELCASEMKNVIHSRCCCFFHLLCRWICDSLSSLVLSVPVKSLHLNMTLSKLFLSSCCSAWAIYLWLAQSEWIFCTIIPTMEKYTYTYTNDSIVAACV